MNILVRTVGAVIALHGDAVVRESDVAPERDPGGIAHQDVDTQAWSVSPSRLFQVLKEVTPKTASPHVSLDEELTDVGVIGRASPQAVRDRPILPLSDMRLVLREEPLPHALSELVNRHGVAVAFVFNQPLIHGPQHRGILWQGAAENGLNRHVNLASKRIAASCLVIERVLAIGWTG